MIGKVRGEELRVMKQYKYVKTCSDSMWSCAPLLVSHCNHGNIEIVARYA